VAACSDIHAQDPMAQKESGLTQSDHRLLTGVFEYKDKTCATRHSAGALRAGTCDSHLAWEQHQLGPHGAPLSDNSSLQPLPVHECIIKLANRAEYDHSL
jgi:hypothetical protein